MYRNGVERTRRGEGPDSRRSPPCSAQPSLPSAAHGEAWDSTVPGGYNPWADDIQKDLVTFSSGTGNPGKGVSMQVGGGMKVYPVKIAGRKLKDINGMHGDKPERRASALEVTVPAGQGGGITFRTSNRQDLSAYPGIAIEVSNIGNT